MFKGTDLDCTGSILHTKCPALAAARSITQSVMGFFLLKFGLARPLHDEPVSRKPTADGSFQVIESYRGRFKPLRPQANFSALPI
jgi:hypothetical protein